MEITEIELKRTQNVNKLQLQKGENPQSLVKKILLLLLVEGVVTCEPPPTCLAPHQNLDTSLGTTCPQPGGEAFLRALTHKK